MTQKQNRCVCFLLLVDLLSGITGSASALGHSSADCFLRLGFATALSGSLVSGSAGLTSLDCTLARLEGGADSAGEFAARRRVACRLPAALRFLELVLGSKGVSSIVSSISCALSVLSELSFSPSVSLAGRVGGADVWESSGLTSLGSRTDRSGVGLGSCSVSLVVVPLRSVVRLSHGRSGRPGDRTSVVIGWVLAVRWSVSGVSVNLEIAASSSS